jgi:predicted porin
MKKILAASSALVAVAFTGQAYASEPINLSVSGYMEQYVGGIQQDKALGDNKNRIQSDTELHFQGMTTLDNGIEVGAAIELEGEGSTNTDEQYLFINGGFGQLKFGSEDGAAADMAISAPTSGGFGPNDGKLDNWSQVSNIDNNTFSGDAQRVTYYTPNIGGFRAGLSYADSDQSEDADTKSLSGNENQVWSAGIEYNGDFNGVSFEVSAAGEYTNPRQGSSNTGTLDFKNGKSYTIGTNIGFGNFTVGGSYGVSDQWYNASTTTTVPLDNPNSAIAAANNTSDSSGFDLGISYAMDAANIALTYAKQTRDDYRAENGTYVKSGTNTELQALSLGMDYTLGSGITWKSNIFWTESDDSIRDAYGVITGMRLAF